MSSIQPKEVDSALEPHESNSNIQSRYDFSIERDINQDLMRLGDNIRQSCCHPILQAAQKQLHSEPAIDGEEIAFSCSENGSQLLKGNHKFSQFQMIKKSDIHEVQDHYQDNQKKSIEESSKNSIHEGKRQTEDELQKSQKCEKSEEKENSEQVKPITKFDQKNLKINSMLQALNLVVIVASFLNQIKQYGTQYKFKRLKQKEFLFIRDKASDYQYYFQNKFFISARPSKLEMCEIFITNTLNKNKLYALIMPNSMIKILWDSWMLFLLILNIFYVPIKMTWESNGGSMQNLVMNEWLKVFLNDLPGWSFLADILFNFNTAFYNKGVIIFNRRKIVKQYLKSKFFGDLIVVIPFIISLRLNITILNSVLIFRTNKMFKLASYFEQLMNLRPQQSALFNLFKLIFTIVFVAHFCGCMFFLVGATEIDMQIFDKTWIDEAHLNEKDWFEQYITSLYWAVITMITIGYGDISPITLYERVFVILITLISCGVFAYSVNQIGTLITALTEHSNSLKVKMGLLIRHLRHRGVRHDLQMQVRKYFEYWHQGNSESEGEYCDQMVESLSNNLRSEVQRDIHLRLINQMPILKLNFSNPFLKNISNHIKTKRTKPEEVLIEEQQVNDKLYYLVQGIVTPFISIKKDNFTSFTQMKQHKANSIFDQVSFMGDLRCLTGYRSLGNCTLYYICKQDFLSELDNFPLDKEKYQLIKDNIIIYKSLRNIGSKCYFCEKYTHSFNCCPQIKYKPYNEKQLMIYNASADHVRMEHTRNTLRFSTLCNLAVTKERALAYLIEKYPFTNEEELIERLEVINKGDEEFEQQIAGQGATKEQNDNYSNQNSTLPEDEHAIRAIPNDLQDPNNSFALHPEAQIAPKISGVRHNYYLGSAHLGEFNDFHGIQRNDSNLHTLPSNFENNLFPQQLSFNGGQTTPYTPSSKVIQLNQGFPLGSFQQLERSTTEQSAEHTQFSNQFAHQQSVHQLQSQNSGLKKKGMKIVRSQSRQKTRNEELNGIKIKSRDIINLGSLNQKSYSLHPSNLKRIDETSNTGENTQESQLNLFYDQKRKGQIFLKTTSISDNKNDFQGGGGEDNQMIERKMRKVSDFKRPTILTNNVAQPSSETDNLLAGLKNSNHQQANQQGNQFLHPSFNNQTSINKQVSDKFEQLHSYSLNPINPESFMPILYLDAMKIYSVYYPSGNYASILQRYDDMRKRRLNIKGAEKLKFQRSVNKIMQIRQLQNMILKKNHSHSKPGLNLLGLKKGTTIETSRNRGSIVQSRGMALPPNSIQQSEIGKSQKI